jgi:hypothetical protein
MHKEDGIRMDMLKASVRTISEIYTLARPEGIVSIRPTYDSLSFDDVTPECVEDVFSDMKFDGITKMGNEVKNRILDPYLYSKNMEIKRPLIVIILTDGEVYAHPETIIYRSLICFYSLTESVAFHCGRQSISALQIYVRKMNSIWVC